MSDLKLVCYLPMENTYKENSIGNLPVEEYFLKLVEYLIKKNKSDSVDVSNLNYSLDKIQELLNNQKQKKMNKALFKKFMKSSKAMKIE